MPLHLRPCMPLCASARAQAASGQDVMRITSTQNAAVKHCVKLRTSGSYRRQMGSVLLVGQDLVLEVAAGGASVEALVGLDGALLPEVRAQRYVAVSEPVMCKLAGLESVSPATLAAEVALPRQPDLLSAAPGSLTRVLALDGIQDPGNLGTLLRSALALGWQAAVLLPGCCDPFNDKALKASRGAAFRLPVVQYSLEQWEELVQQQGLLALAAEPDRAAAAAAKHSSSGNGGAAGHQQQQGRQQVTAATASSSSSNSSSLAEVQQRLTQLPLCLCLGAEGQGVSPGVLQGCTSISIPQAGDMESLNAAAAGAILMFALSSGAVVLLAELASLPGAGRKS